MPGIGCSQCRQLCTLIATHFNRCTSNGVAYMSSVIDFLAWLLSGCTMPYIVTFVVEVTC